MSSLLASSWLLALWTVGSPSALQPAPLDRFALAERLKRVEVAWMQERHAEHKRKAAGYLTQAVTGFFAGDSRRASSQLDEALAVLDERALRPADALTLKPAQFFYEPGAEVSIRASWSYRPNSVLPVMVAAGSESIRLRPGEDGVIKTQPIVGNPDLRLNPEVGYLVPVRINDDVRLVYVNFVRNYESRIRRLSGSQLPAVKVLGEFLRRSLEEPESVEADLPLIQYLFAAEALEEGRQRIVDQDQVYLAKQGSTFLRAQFPRPLRSQVGREVDVVIAVHGAGGSENMFFEAYGRGMAVSETLRRGWVFLSPRAGSESVANSLSWLTEVRRLRPRRIFLIGHSMGGGVVLGYPGRVTAVAALAPAVGRLPDSMATTPLFLAVGDLELPMLKSGVLGVANRQGGRKDFQLREVENSEHLMVVADALPEAFRFFDRYATGR